MRIATAGVRTGFAMTGYLQGVRCAAGHTGPALRILWGVVGTRADVGIGPYNRISAPRKKTAERRSFSCIYLL